MIGLLLLLLWLSRRRRRIDERVLPRQYIDHEVPVGRDKNGRLARYTSQMESTDEFPSPPHPVRLQPENDEVGIGNGTPDEETLPVRMRRVEAQLAALLNVGLPHSAPPSYTG